MSSRKRMFMMLAALTLCAPACAKAPPRTAAGEEGVRTAKAQALEGWLARYAQSTATIKALGWLDLSDGAEERQTDAAIVIARPTSVRVDAMDALADVWAQAGSDGSRLWLFLPARDKLYSGRASRSNLHRLLRFDWEVAEVVSVVAGSPPLPERAELSQVGSPRENHFVARDGGLHLWTDPKSGLPVKCARYEAGGAVIDYLVTFGDWRKAGDVDFPHRIEATFPGRRARIVVVYRDVTLGGAVDRAAFFAPARGRGKTVELK